MRKLSYISEDIWIALVYDLIPIVLMSALIAFFQENFIYRFVFLFFTTSISYSAIYILVRLKMKISISNEGMSANNQNILWDEMDVKYVRSNYRFGDIYEIKSKSHTFLLPIGRANEKSILHLIKTYCPPSHPIFTIVKKYSEKRKIVDCALQAG